MTILDLFHAFVTAHIITGAIGLVLFWVPVISKKGGDAHKRAGRIFNWSMIATGISAILMSVCTVYDPMGTHPQLENHAIFGNPALVKAIFGWMMLGLAIMTINLTWYGWLCVTYRRDRLASREWRSLSLQALTFIAATNCAWQGYLIGQPLMLGMSFIGWATVATNLFYLYRPNVGPNEWLKEHVKGLVGTGISVYTAFFAFGAVRTFPSIALHPILWAIPLTVGLSIILYHHRRLSRPMRQMPASQTSSAA